MTALKCVLILLIGFAAIVCAPQASSSATWPSSCVPSRGELVGGNSFVRLYRRADLELVACRRSKRKPQRLMPTSKTYRAVGLRGSVVAFGTITENDVGNEELDTFVVIDLADGHRRLLDDAGSVMHVVVLDREHFAWIACDGGGGPSRRTERCRVAPDTDVSVRLYDGPSKTTSAPDLRVDDGPDVAARSLVLSGRTLSWRRGPDTKHATFR